MGEYQDGVIFSYTFSQAIFSPVCTASMYTQFRSYTIISTVQGCRRQTPSYQPLQYIAYFFIFWLVKYFVLPGQFVQAQAVRNACSHPKGSQQNTHCNIRSFFLPHFWQATLIEVTFNTVIWLAFTILSGDKRSCYD